MKGFKSFLLSTVFLASTTVHCYNVGLLIMATGRYVEFIPSLIDSARTYFCTNHNVTFFVFTDGQLEPTDDTVVIFQERLGWPYDTMMRFDVYYKSRDQFKTMDYLFGCDADMLFVNYVGDEILSDRVATQHPGFLDRQGDYEKRPSSTAYVANNEGTHYFAGGFYGGSRDETLALLRTNTKNIETDLAHNIIAIWHDESHLNRYFIDNPPTLILSPSYCYPEELVDNYYAYYSPKILEYTPKLIARDKNHNEYRPRRRNNGTFFGNTVIGDVPRRRTSTITV